MKKNIQYLLLMTDMEPYLLCFLPSHLKKTKGKVVECKVPKHILFKGQHGKIIIGVYGKM